MPVAEVPCNVFVVDPVVDEAVTFQVFLRLADAGFRAIHTGALFSESSLEQRCGCRAEIRNVVFQKLPAAQGGRPCYAGCIAAAFSQFHNPHTGHGRRKRGA